MPLRIAFDLDGTVADMNSSLRREATALFRSQPATKPPESDEAKAPGASPDPAGEAPAEADELRLSARQQMQLWDHVKKIENFWTTLTEVEPGIVKRIA